MVFNPEGKEHLQLISSDVIYRYIHAGKGELTLAAPSGTAHTYQFLSPRNVDEFPEGTIFVYVLHKGHKIYLGKLEEKGFRLTARSTFDKDTDAVRGAYYIVKMAYKQSLVNNTPMKLYQSGKCCKCGRNLHGDWAIKEGIGRKCLKKYEKIVERTPWDGNI